MKDQCWYCKGTQDPMSFSTEFDTPVHLVCILHAVRRDPNDQEALIMHRELINQNVLDAMKRAEQ